MVTETSTMEQKTNVLLRKRNATSAEILLHGQMNHQGLAMSVETAHG
jgi:hypothetical protein